MGEIIRYFGYGKEVTFGSEAAASKHLDMASSSLDTPSDQDIIYEGSMGRGLNIARPGYYVPPGNVVAAMDLRWLGLWLRHTLGGYKITAAGDETVEEWTLELGGATGGFFRLGNGSVWTECLAHNATAQDIEDALVVIYGAGKVTVTDVAVPPPDFDIVFDATVRESGLVAELENLQGATGEELVQTQEFDGAHALHEMWMSANNVLPSFTARVGKDLFEHVFLGTVVNSLQLQVAGELLMGTLDCLAQKDDQATLTAVANLLLDDEYPLAFHEVTAYLAAVGVTPTDEISADVKEVTMNFGNNLGADRGRSIGSRFAARLVAEQFECNLSLSLFFTDTSWLEDYWGTASGPSGGPDSVVEKACLFEFDGGVYGKCKILFPRLRMTGIQIQPSGRGEIVQPVEVQAFQATTTLDDGVTEVTTPVLVSLENDEGDME